MLKRNVRGLLRQIARMLMVGTLMAGACTPAPVLPREQAEQELVSFVLHYILPSRPGQATSYVERSGAHWADAPANASIVVWAPPQDSWKNATIQYVKSDEPIKVWWYADQQLTEVVDGEHAIQVFRQAHFSGSYPPEPTGSYFEFGILSLSKGNQEAEVYAATWCAPLCGSGTHYTVSRSAAGTWGVVKAEMKWIS